jgi:hypothetical protein
MDAHPTPQSGYGHADEDAITGEIAESSPSHLSFKKIYNHADEEELEKEIEKGATSEQR